jgi:hypothetical protein
MRYGRRTMYCMGIKIPWSLHRGDSFSPAISFQNVIRPSFRMPLRIHHQRHKQTFSRNRTLLVSSIMISSAPNALPFRALRNGTNAERSIPRSLVHLYHNSTPNNPSMTSSPTPPFSTTALMIAVNTPLFIPPLGGFQTPFSSVPSLAAKASSGGSGRSPVATLFKALGIPGVVSLDGGSTVLSARSFKSISLPLLFASSAKPTLIATTASATASSSFEGSKM